MGERSILVTAVGLSVPLTMVGVFGYPFFHNEFLHPLGRLSRDIEVGQTCDQVSEMFTIYMREHAVSSRASASEHQLTHDLLRHHKDLPPSRGLSLYDESVFDDLQIRVRCDAAGKVAETLRILD